MPQHFCPNKGDNKRVFLGERRVPNSRVKLSHGACLIDHYWLCVLRHTFTPRPLEAPSSLCVTSSLSRRSWRSYSRGAKWNRNFSTAATWTRRGRTRTPRNRPRRSGERRRGTRPPRQVGSISVRGRRRIEGWKRRRRRRRKKKKKIASSGATKA